MNQKEGSYGVQIPCRWNSYSCFKVMATNFLSQLDCKIFWWGISPKLIDESLWFFVCWWKFTIERKRNTYIYMKIPSLFRLKFKFLFWVDMLTRHAQIFSKSGKEMLMFVLLKIVCNEILGHCRPLWKVFNVVFILLLVSSNEISSERFPRLIWFYANRWHSRNKLVI